MKQFPPNASSKNIFCSFQHFGHGFEIKHNTCASVGQGKSSFFRWSDAPEKGKSLFSRWSDAQDMASPYFPDGLMLQKRASPYFPYGLMPQATNAILLHLNSNTDKPVSLALNCQ
ncbi:hypothetical protein PoB_002681400 [Plakobranchus ocellatus]|uniref:Uncharacterized protein n=1 Tax=Plakobranchus ocellatus TaxID=259542 RepID=A0AAV4A146_9GAST|nr:hypothetical protein PoB_002681400 [Plakobranchus ocellatus]